MKVAQELAGRGVTGCFLRLDGEEMVRVGSVYACEYIEERVGAGWAVGSGVFIRHYVSNLTRQTRHGPDGSDCWAGFAALTGSAGARLLQQSTSVSAFGV